MTSWGCRVVGCVGLQPRALLRAPRGVQPYVCVYLSPHACSSCCVVNWARPWSWPESLMRRDESSPLTCAS